MNRILLTGATGFLGRHVQRVLENHFGCSSVIAVGSKDGDLTRMEDCLALFEKHRPNQVVHLAAYSGGIGANRDYPADFFFINSMLTSVVFEAAARSGVEKILYTMGGCSYPANAKSPINEEQLFVGFPQAESAGYSMAKAMGAVAAKSYEQQYGMQCKVVIPGNMYGPYDNFRNGESHVVPALIRRFHEAKLSGVSEVVAWGSGSPVRDFVFVSDVAETIPFFLENYDQQSPVNISTGTTTSIKELTLLVAELIGFDGEVTWDTSKPDGQMIKIFDTSRLASLGLTCPTTLTNGLEKTVDWFQRNYADQSDFIRL